MPIRSMTGYGLAEGVTASGTYIIEIRGINNRFLEVQFRLPKFLSSIEQIIKKEISKVISRGSILLTITCNKEDSTKKISFNPEVIDSYLKIMREIIEKYSLKGDVTLSELLNFEDVIKVEDIEFNEEELWSHISPILEQALFSFQCSRETEGAFIAESLRKMSQEIETSLQEIEKKAPYRIEKYAKELRERISKLIENPPDENRIATEIAICAEKLDISEECVRLRAHLNKFKEDFETNEPVGKRMSFILQEMNREANTIAAKANDAEIVHLSILMREIIEKIREQVQNIE
ncbi:MAG: YicC family protein [Chitinispirillaceae bacterium]|nr:YicC family protein [Chitinispirillaceae bacterium]